MELKDIQNPSETAKRFKEVVKPKKNEIQKFLTSQILDQKINSREELIDTLQQGTSKNRRFQPATVSSGLKSSGLPVL